MKKYEKTLKKYESKFYNAEFVPFPGVESIKEAIEETMLKLNYGENTEFLQDIAEMVAKMQNDRCGKRGNNGNRRTPNAF